MAATAAAGSASVLTAHLDLPVVAKTTVQADLLHALQVVAELGVQGVGHGLAPLALLAVLLGVEEPVGDVELTGVGDDGLDGLNLILGQLTSALGEVDVSLLADQVGETTADT